ncbi:MAG: nucleoside triphosphate pyrophosphohydrolase [candidate division WOR-3 bacterium]|nr:nucleoside triphosphate pyrophosphohydrolase [candidate division WOR-3 bacterium]
MRKRITDPVRELIRLVKTLRKKCPWDRKQTLSTMRSNVIEEAYEVVDAIERKDLSAIREEIGDLLFLGFFLVQLLEDRGIKLKEIVESTVNKYRSKHPHVYKSKKIGSAEEVIRFWHSSKKDVFEGIPYILPALTAARLIQERAAKLGFDWQDKRGPFKKLIEEIDELKNTTSRRGIEEEIGDILFSCVNLARHLKVEPEEALRKANKKFVDRFRKMQKEIVAEKKELNVLSIEEMDRVWNRIKNKKR